MKRAYLIVDMSNDFVASDGSLTSGEPAQAIVGNILKRIEEFALRGEPIVFCMDSHEESDKHFELWPKHNVVGTYGAELYKELKIWYDEHKNDPNVYFLPKSEYDAFYNTELDDILKKEAVDTVYVSGVCTDICVFNTVYGAYKLGYKTVAARNECATFTQNGELFLNHMNAIYKTEII